MTWRQAIWDTPTVFEKDRGPASTVAAPEDWPAWLRRATTGLPTLSRAAAVRHFVQLSHKTVGVDVTPVPLGSCTMKLNPKTAELAAQDPNLGWVHPYQPEEQTQGVLRVLHDLQTTLASIAGMDAVSLQPAAGAQGEFTAMLMVRALMEHRGEARNEVIVPDSAHGTNPASAAAAGFDVIEIPSAADGSVDLKALEAALSERTAALMITNPNTLGVFERGIDNIQALVHDAGAILYYDGANLNAILGVTNPGVMGFDLVHFNLHKTFATPHGGGGPGAGPVGARGDLAQYLPAPRVGRAGERYYLDWGTERSIGPVRAHVGNVGVLVRAYAYILMLGGDGLAAATRAAVANANYVSRRLQDLYPAVGGPVKKHETVLTAKPLLDQKGVRAMDVAKRLLDYGIHAPTVYFPLTAPEALMIEPTETEDRASLDALIGALRAIAQEDPDVLRGAPHNTAVARVDEVLAARKPVLTWDMAAGAETPPA